MNIILTIAKYEQKEKIFFMSKHLGNIVKRLRNRNIESQKKPREMLIVIKCQNIV